MRRLTTEFVRNLFKDRKYIPLFDEYINNDQKLKYICPKGHIGYILLGNFKRGSGCSICFYKKNSEKQRLPIEFVRNIFIQKKLIPLFDKYINSNTKLSYKCENGHINEITLSEIKNGSGCPDCFHNSQRFEFNFIKKQFENRKYIPLFTEYINVNQKLKFICPDGHHGEITYKSFSHGYECIECSRITTKNKTKRPYNEIKEEFEERKYILVSKEYINNRTKLEFICPKGHHGFMIYGYFHQGQGCRECARIRQMERDHSNEKRQKTWFSTEFIQNKFIERGYNPLFNEYINSYQKLEFICPEGHHGFMTYASFRQGHDCIICGIEKKRGEKSVNWDPTLTEQDRIEHRESRRDRKYGQWRKQVKNRDYWTCRHCGITSDQCKKDEDNRIEAHHIFGFSYNVRLRYDIFNGITFCEKCHILFHSLFGKHDNNPDQIHEFIYDSQDLIKNRDLVKSRQNIDTNSIPLEEKKHQLVQLHNELMNKKDISKTVN